MRAFSGSLAEMFFRRHPAGRPSPEEAMAERLLAGRGAGPGAPSGHQALERVLAAASRPATRRELSGEAAAVAAFVLAARTNGAHGSGARHRRPGRRPAARRPAYKLPAVAAALTMMMFLVIGGTAAAGALPEPLQRLAHTTFGAPAPGDTGQHPATGNPQDGQGTSSPATTASHQATTPGGTGSTAPTAGADNAQGQEPTPAPTATTHTTKTSGGQGNGNGQGNGKGSGQGVRPTTGPHPTPTPPAGSTPPGKSDGQG